MRIEFENFSENPVTALRRLGYTFQRNEGDQMSFVRVFSASGYPRFHMYVRVDSGKMTINIHLDMKKETYGDDTRHHGEYENSDALTDEVRRIKSMLE
jgi:hypothetical protein